MLLVLLLFRLTKWMKVSMESAIIPVPLFLEECRIVSHMSPGKYVECVLGGLGKGGVSKDVTGCGYKFSTNLKFELSIVAILLNVQALLIAVL